MHTGPIPESAGTLTGEQPAKLHQCRNCLEPAATMERWDSSCGGYTDYKFTCARCGFVRWEEGADA